MTLTSGTSRAFPVFVQGLALSLGLIVAIGVRNAFVPCQGLRRKHAGSVVLFCAVADAVLIAAGVLGMVCVDWRGRVVLATPALEMVHVSVNSSIPAETEPPPGSAMFWV